MFFLRTCGTCAVYMFTSGVDAFQSRRLSRHLCVFRVGANFGSWKKEPMTICKYYAQGSCKFGDQCRYEHPDANGNNVAAMTDPFARSTADGQLRAKSSDRHPKKTTRPPRDIPQWPLTSVGAHPLASGNTITGDMSQEELRAEAYAAAPRGMSSDIVHREETLVAEFQQRNNGSPLRPGQAANSGDPFADSGAGSHPQQAHQQQESIFNPTQQHSSIFTPSAAQAPMGFAANPPGNGFAFEHAQSGANTFTSPGTALPNMSMSPQGAPESTGLSNADAFSQAQFAFQKVPETPTSLGYQ
jgi:CCCH-type zinc finger